MTATLKQKTRPKSAKPALPYQKAGHGEIKRDARISVKLTPQAKAGLRDVVQTQTGERISISEMLERLAKGQLSLVISDPAKV